MDLFSGEGGVSSQCERLGFRAKEWDIRHGPHQDLTQKAVLKRILAEIKKGRVLAVMMAPVCTSFSRARDRTKVIRNKRFPWGIPFKYLSPKEASSIRLGNSCFRTCFRIIELCNSLSIPWILENPRSSRCWNLPFIRELLDHQAGFMGFTDFCQHGTPWKKPTAFLYNHIVDYHRLTRLCSGQRGLCSRSQRKHFLLTGTGPQGKPWTVHAQPYPKSLCKDLAHALTSKYHATFEF